MVYTSIILLVATLVTILTAWFCVRSFRPKPENTSKCQNSFWCVDGAKYVILERHSSGVIVKYKTLGFKCTHHFTWEYLLKNAVNDWMIEEAKFHVLNNQLTNLAMSEYDGTINSEISLRQNFETNDEYPTS